MLSDQRDTWTCPDCRETSHVIAGQDHAARHAPYCRGPAAQPQRPAPGSL